jgi:OOP family OmpA-OmpF porin
MKKQIILFALLLASAGLNAQTKDQKNNISLGGGKESYNGDLGNSWFDPSEEWYGFVHASYSRYLNPSFDFLTFGTVGDIGRCRADDSPVNTLNLYARMSSGIVTLKYKFANGYLLREDAKIAPYIFLGGGASNMTDIWNHKDVNPGTYYSFNGGAGFKYNFCKRYNIGYNIGFGYFTSDRLDYIIKAHGLNDMYMQHTFSLGFNF